MPILEYRYDCLLLIFMSYPDYWLTLYHELDITSDLSVIFNQHYICKKAIVSHFPLLSPLFALYREDQPL